MYIVRRRSVSHMNTREKPYNWKKIEEAGAHKGQEGNYWDTHSKESGRTPSNQSPWIFRRSFGMVDLFFKDVFKLGPKNREMEGQRRNLVPARAPESSNHSLPNR